MEGPLSALGQRPEVAGVHMGLEGQVGGSTDLGRVGGPSVNPPEEPAAWNDLHSVLDLRHGVHFSVSVLHANGLKHRARWSAAGGSGPWASFTPF